MLQLNILPDSQRQLWNELQQTPHHFVLYGGTALALRLGHRQSVDFDFFTNQEFIPSKLYESIPYLNQAKIIQSETNTLVCLVDRQAPVQVSFFGGLNLNRVQDPYWEPQAKIFIASLIDIAATKVKVVLDRASAKDYIDLCALLENGVSLAEALQAAMAIYGKAYNPLLSLKALSFFEDGDLKNFPKHQQEKLLAAIQTVAIENLSQAIIKPGLKP